jgi:hypothetical protein
LSLLLVALKHQLAFTRGLFIEEVAFAVKRGELFRFCQAILNDVTGHQAARFFSVEANDFELAVLLIKEYDWSRWDLTSSVPSRK